MDYINKFSQILDNDNGLREEELPCNFKLGNLEIEIKSLDTFEHELITL